jgi:hypothetical protein
VMVTTSPAVTPSSATTNRPPRVTTGHRTHWAAAAVSFTECGYRAMPRTEHRASSTWNSTDVGNRPIG